ncbi:MAG TPA: VOC family protein [Actinomycetes bacterium]|nr:VOC family protein [Actinomycetes bacterium]
MLKYGPRVRSLVRSSTMRLEAFDHVALNVSNLERSTRWYQEVLGLRRTYADAWPNYPVVLEAGGSGVALFPSHREGKARYPDMEEVAMQQLAFRTSRQHFESAKAELGDRGIEFVERDHGIAWSVYLRDPDGFDVEITTYEPVSE